MVSKTPPPLSAWHERASPHIAYRTRPALTPQTPPWRTRGQECAARRFAEFDGPTSRRDSPSPAAIPDDRIALGEIAKPHPAASPGRHPNTQQTPAAAAALLARL